MLTEAQKNFRNAMSKLAAAVNIVSTNGCAGKCGITATAVCSITDTPPTILVCINKKSTMNCIFAQNKYVCINVLKDNQEELAHHFAGLRNSQMHERFEWEVWHPHQQDEVPVLKDALANLKGKIVEIKEIGTHSMFLVELDEISVQDGKGLVYFDRTFHSVGG